MEIYRAVPGYSDYEVSNYGNIKHNGVLMKQYTDDRGRKRVNMNRKGFFVHRLVAKTFPEICGDYFEGAVVDHIDTNQSNNNATNLRFCTQHENLLNPITRVRKSTSKMGDKNPMCNKTSYRHHNSRPIVQLTHNNELVNVWYCTMDVYRKLGYSYKAISLALNHKTNSSFGYKWLFLDEYLSEWLYQYQCDYERQCS